VSRADTRRVAPRHGRPVPAAGVEGNEKLTAMTGALLLVGFAVEGVTIVSIHRLLFWHFLIGLVLIGPVLLKIGSTMYRFVRYYAGSLPYVRKGPPSPVLRVLGPLVIMTSVAVLGTGVILDVAGRSGAWLFLHKASFVLWFGVLTVHVLNYAPRLPRMLAARQQSGGAYGAAVPGGPVRWALLAASVGVGVGVAAVSMQISAQWGVRF
jgi:hypothetical protein